MKATTAIARGAALALAVHTAACAGDDENGKGHIFDIIDVSVAGALPDPIVFSWSGDVTTLKVVACADMTPCPLECTDGLLSQPKSIRGGWTLGAFTDYQSPIASPVTYGMLGSTPDPNAAPLEPGLLHGIEVNRYGPCPPEEKDCDALLVAVGCALFTP